MASSREYPRLETICDRFEQEWNGPEPLQLAHFVKQGEEQRIPVEVLLPELMAIELDLSLGGKDESELTFDLDPYLALFPYHDLLLSSLVSQVSRLLEERLSRNEVVEIEALAEFVGMPWHQDAVALDLLEAEHRLRYQYELRSREADYARRYPHLWPSLRDRLIEAGLPVDELAAKQERHEPVRLEVVSGPHQGETFEFTDHQSIVVGRGSQCGMKLGQDPYFSRYHLRIEANPPLCHIVDLDSRNGTFVNGFKIREATLRNGDQVSGGQTTLRVVIGQRSAASKEAIHSSTVKWNQSVDGPADESSRGSELAEPAPMASARQLEPFDIPGYRLLSLIESDSRRALYNACCFDDRQPLLIKHYYQIDVSDDRALAALADPGACYRQAVDQHVIPVVDIGRFRRKLFVVVPFVEHASRDQVWGSKPNATEVRSICEVVSDALASLQTLQNAGCVHGHLHPRNLLLVPVESTDAKRDPGGHRVVGRITDFGLDRRLLESGMHQLYQTSRANPMLAYLPPERLLEIRNATVQGDVYAMGAILYYFLTGRHPVDSIDATTSMASILNGGVRSIRDFRGELPTELITVVERAMHAQPERRFQSPGEMLEALAPLTH